MNILKIIGRNEELFSQDIFNLNEELNDVVANSSFLVIGGAGSIGQSVSREIFRRNPNKLHVVDISENNMVELVRDLRSTMGYSDGEFKTFAIDCGGEEFLSLVEHEGPYDYIFNLSALKHVRSEEDPYTLMRMIQVNIFNTIKTIRVANKMDSKNYFCVSTDKAANPVNMMGASKKIMEMFLMKESINQKLSMARFANVAFSDGSLLHGFNQRFMKGQPFAAPKDIRRYFITPKESGELCLISGIFGNNRDIFFPKLDSKLNLIKFSDIAIRYLEARGFEPLICSSEEEARKEAKNINSTKKWPCFFFNSDTTGEKEFEEFFTNKEDLNLDKFISIGIINNSPEYNEIKLSSFASEIEHMVNTKNLDRENLKKLFYKTLPDFDHKETGKFLNQKM